MHRLSMVSELLLRTLYPEISFVHRCLHYNSCQCWAKMASGVLMLDVLEISVKQLCLLLIMSHI